METKDELADLAKVFNKIAEELESSQQQQESTEKAVGLKVQARTQALEETINALEQKVQNRTAELSRLVGDSDQLKKELSDLRKKLDKPGKTKPKLEENI